MKKKIIAIVGPTTAPGRGLIRAILNDKQGQFTARALTRDISSEEAQLLTMTGIEVAHGDLDDEATLRQAFSDAYGVFCFLLSKEPGAVAPTRARAAALARASKGAALQHVVWATLDDTALLPLQDEEVTPTYLDQSGKLEIDGTIDMRQVFTDLAVPTTFLEAAWRSSLVTGRTAEEIGQCAYRIFQNRELVGKTVSVSEELMALEMALPPVTTTAPGRLSRTATAWLLGAFAAVVLGSVAVMIRFYHQPSEVAPHPFSERTGITQSRPTRSFGPLKPRDPAIDPVINPVTTADTAMEEPPSLLASPTTRPRPKKRASHAGLAERLRAGGSKGDGSGAPTPVALASGAPAPAPVATTMTTESRASVAPSSSAPRVDRNPTVSATLPRPGPAPATERVRSLPPPAGSVDPRAITAVVRTHAAEVRACFDRALMEHADLHGRVLVKAMLDASGNVVSATATRTIDGGARLEACVLSAFQSWTFPTPADGSRAPITYSFSFD